MPLGSLGAVDLLSIVIWKANRAKSKVAKRLLRRADDLESACRALTGSVFAAASPVERLAVLLGEWGFKLPMASAILTVLWPAEFTIYNVRVCAELKEFQKLGSRPAGSVWSEYCRYMQAVDAAVPLRLSLRDKDRYLWGRSAVAQLRVDIERWEIEARSATKIKYGDRL